MSRPAAALALAACLCFQESAPPPQAPGFRYEAGRMPLGRVMRYKKSNRDGSHPSEIALYVAGESSLEALKWNPGEPEATLVVAELDWPVCSVKSFHTYKLEGEERRVAAVLETSADRKRLTARVDGRELATEIPRFPWHSYDFDFASLNLALRFLLEPEGEVEFQIIDPAYGPGGASLVAKGPAFLSYAGADEHAGVNARRYTLDGPGLEERGGELWTTRGDDVWLLGFELDLPDEPGMSSGKLEWLRNETRTAEEWASFVRERKDSVK